jgi:hypothetical protein
MKVASAVLCGVVMAAVYADSAQAHHSFAMFDRSKSVALQGTLKSVQLINPHSWFVLTAAGADGVVKDWSLEGPSPNILLRQGWKHDDMKAGDRVTLTFNPLKDGSPGGVLVSVKLPSGRELSAVPVGAPPGFAGPPPGATPGGPPGGPPGAPPDATK